MLIEPTAPRARLALESTRVAARLVALGPHRTPVELMRQAVDDLAALAWSAEQRAGSPPQIRVGAHGWRDVVMVLVDDLLALTPDVAELRPTADRLTRLRRELP